MNTKDPKLYGVAGHRITQKNVVPTTFKKKLFGEIATVTNLASGSTTLSNGDQAVFTATTEQDQQFDLLNAEPFISLYIGTVTAANQLPGGSGVDESQWQVIGPFYDYQSWNGSKYQSKMIVYVRNISAGASQTVNIRIKPKVITRSENIS